MEFVDMATSWIDPAKKERRSGPRRWVSYFGRNSRERYIRSEQ